MKIDLEQTIQSLPVADESYDWQGIKFDIYLAKNFFDNQWCNDALRLLVLKCRESFHRYGDVAVEDGYDKKSLVTIVGVSYLVNERLVKEWITIRLVPAFGEPFLSEDLQVKFADEQSLFEKIKEKLLPDNNDTEKRLFTISRFCGIAPYYQDSFQSVEGSKKIKFTLLSFILLCRFSLNRVSLVDRHFFITAMFHHNIFERLGFFKYGDKQSLFELPDIHETLSVDLEGLKIFNPGPVSFRHPTYFFRIKELLVWVKKMIDDGKINNVVLKNEINWEEIEKDLNENKLNVITRFASLGELLGDDNLKKSLTAEVPLSLILKLIHQAELEIKISKFLDDLNFND